MADPLSRRGFLRVAALTGGGLAAASIAACAPGAAPVWTFSPGRSMDPNAPAPSASATAAASPAMSHDAGHSAAPATPAAGGSNHIPPGWSEHDVTARNGVRRYLGNLVPMLGDIYPPAVVAKLADILGVEDDYPELKQKPSFAQVPQPRPDRRAHAGDARARRRHEGVPPDDRRDRAAGRRAACHRSRRWATTASGRARRIRVNQGDKVRAIFKNNLKETTGVHFHGVEFDDFFQDGVVFVTQKPIVPGEEYAYEFTANNAGSLMYHSHHNATDQVGRGLLGAFIVDPPQPQTQYDREYLWISNDTLGGFTINGHGFPAVVPVLAAQGERVLLRFMNEGVMMHPWHSHGYFDGARGA